MINIPLQSPSIIHGSVLCDVCLHALLQVCGRVGIPLKDKFSLLSKSQYIKFYLNPELSSILIKIRYKFCLVFQCCMVHLSGTTPCFQKTVVVDLHTLYGLISNVVLDS